MDSELHRRAAEMDIRTRPRRRERARSPELVAIEAGIDEAVRTMERERRARRPIGVAMLALCYLGAGTTGLALLVGFLVIGALTAGSASIVGVVVLIGVLGFISWLIFRGGLLMWRLQARGWWFGAVTALMVGAMSAVALVDHAISGTLGQPPRSNQFMAAGGLYGGRLAVSALTVWYLFRPGVLEAFFMTPAQGRQAIRRSALAVVCAGAAQAVLLML